MPGFPLWREPRPALVPRRGWRDYALAGLVVVAALAEFLTRDDLPNPAVALLLTAGLTPALLWRREKPLLMVLIVFSVAAVVPFLTRGVAPEMYATIYMLFFPFALFRWGSGREMILGAAAIATKLAVSLAAGQVSPADTVGGLVILSAVATAGAALRYRAGARVREFERVRLLEREKLARDLHDTVAHHVSAMAIRAQAGLATAAAKPQAAADALRVIEAEASRALAEMRTMVRVLRQDEDVDYSPSPVAEDLHGLAGNAGPGAPVTVDIDGDLGLVPAPLGAAIYRMAQESVTNAHRHARHATRICVRVFVREREVELEVSDDGTPATASGNGYGLRGMRERAQLLGGTFHAGPVAGSSAGSSGGSSAGPPAAGAVGGGWKVVVRLPLNGPRS